jgi:hypothetical protein
MLIDNQPINFNDSIDLSVIVSNPITDMRQGWVPFKAYIMEGTSAMGIYAYWQKPSDASLSIIPAHHFAHVPMDYLTQFPADFWFLGGSRAQWFGFDFMNNTVYPGNFQDVLMIYYSGAGNNGILRIFAPEGATEVLIRYGNSRNTDQSYIQVNNVTAHTATASTNEAMYEVVLPVAPKDEIEIVEDEILLIEYVMFR